MKKIVFICGITIFIILSFLYPSVVLAGATNGLALWFQHLLPTLLPYIILSNIIIQSGLLDIESNAFKPTFPWRPVLITYLFGLILGLPIGAILVTNFYRRKMISKAQATILVCSCNPLSPFFYINYILHHNAASGNRSIASYLIPLYLLHSCVGALFLFVDYHRSHKDIVSATMHKKTTSRFHLSFQIIDAGIMNGFEVITKLGGYVILFGILTSLWMHIIPTTSPLGAIGIASLEISNGISILGATLPNRQPQINIMMSMATFGGLCTHALTYSIISGTNLSKISYSLAKISLALLTYCLLNLITIILC